MHKAKVWTLAALAILLSGCAESLSQGGAAGAVALSPSPSPDHAGRVDAIFPNGNSCAPDAPEPAWGPSDFLLGYRCIRANANGG